MFTNLLIMKYSHTIFYVEDVNETVIFYEKAFRFKKNMITGEWDYAELKSGETTIWFASLELGKSNLWGNFTVSSNSKNPFWIEMAFITDNLEKDFQKAINEWAILFKPIEKKEWWQKVWYVKDNNGFLIELAEPMDY